MLVWVAEKWNVSVMSHKSVPNLQHIIRQDKDRRTCQSSNIFTTAIILIFLQMEMLITFMNDQKTGIPLQNKKHLLSTIHSSFSGTYSQFCFHNFVLGERCGVVVECQTLNLEVLGSISTGVIVLCP